MKTLIESQYFPCIEYFSLIKNRSEVWIETKEYFVKQTYRNRCYILGSQDILPLAIPMIGGNKKIAMDEIKIDYGQKWLNNHWRAIISCYNKSPFFEYYEPYFHDILFRKHETLLALNQELLTFCLKVLNIDTPIKYTSIYKKGPFNETEDVRSVIHPKSDYICREFYTPISYQQLFGNKFAANLSILDLLSCVGPEADKYL
ncbi:MAG: WbqC family protein [Reichenbachiella sp.]|uniref:WbqC family protein n=1 Tax=Reichenbachiella sp. TaxID=2184521 RepID=UPI00326673CA